jgi:drug/metabolite transporter (DMT)-like permease
MNGCYLYALVYTPLPDAFLLSNSHVIILLLATAAKEFRVEPLKLLGILACIAGALLTTLDPGESGADPDDPPMV